METRVYSERPRFTDDVPERDESTIAIDVGAWSRKGASRRVNEDCFATASLAISRKPAAFFAAVADGMGGEAAGQRASRIAARSMLETLSALSARHLERKPEQALCGALTRAHEEVLEDASRAWWRAGMGTTLTAVLVLWPRAHLIHAGDSRGYLAQRGNVARLTHDHTVSEMLLARGQLSPEAARTSHYRHVLWNHLGGDAPMPEPQVVAFDLEAGDGLLLATDGLSDLLADSELAEIASRPVSAHAVSHMLVETAAGRGGRDDTTALFARFGPV
jgi:protein phosphatase